MIIKNLTRKSGTGQLLSYLFRYITAEEKTTTKPFIVRHNIRSNSIAGYVKEFEQNEMNRIIKRKDQTCIHHTIISWSNKDAKHLNDNILRDLAKAYIRFRGELNLYVITKHVDKEHTYLHAAMSASQINGKSSRISKLEFENLKKSLDAYQKEHYAELVNSLPHHGKKRESILNAWKKVDSELEELYSIRKRNNKESEKDFVRSLNIFESELEGLNAFHC